MRANPANPEVPQHERRPLSWSQVVAFRLRRHHLAEPAAARDLASVVAEIGGAQAQLVSAAEISIWTRVRDLAPGTVETALWHDRILAKAWCMRRTFHLIPSARAAVFVRGSARRSERELDGVRERGLRGPRLEELLATVLDALGEPRTRAELATRVGESLGLRVGEMRGGGWGSQRSMPCVVVGGLRLPAGFLLHLVGARGVVCCAPARGTEATYVRADAWLPRWRDISQAAAETELLRTYLRAYAPATPIDYAWWTGMYSRDARAIWSRLEKELAPVDVEGWAAWVLRRDLSPLETTTAEPARARLLPYFDAFLLGHRNKQHLVEESHRAEVYRNQGWVAPVVLAGGRAVAVWSHAPAGKRLRIRIRPFKPLPRRTSSELRGTARELGRFLGYPQVDLSMGNELRSAKASPHGR